MEHKSRASPEPVHTIPSISSIRRSEKEELHFHWKGLIPTPTVTIATVMPLILSMDSGKGGEAHPYQSESCEKRILQSCLPGRCAFHGNIKLTGMLAG